MEDILFVIIVNHTVESDILSTRIHQILFLQLGLKFTSDREDVFFEMCIFKAGYFSGHAEEEQKLETNEIIYHI